MAPLRTAMSFLTVLPAGHALPPEGTGGDLARSMAWFPAVGFLLGGVMWFLALGLKGFPVAVAAFVIVSFEAAVTGFLHLDGLADWADGRAGRRPQDVLRIMKDSTNGAYGVCAIALVLIGKFAAVSALLGGSATSRLALVTAPVLSRWSLTFLARSSPYARPEGGTGGAFVDNFPPNSFLISSAFTALVMALTLSVTGWVHWGVALGVSLWIRRDSIRRMGGITGDVMGAAGELSALAVLLAAALMI